MSRRLDDLDAEFKPRAMELLARCAEAGVPVMVIYTFRTEVEQAELVAKGLSWTKFSRHQIGRAIDICPYEIFQLHGPDKLQWNSSDPVWTKIGELGERKCGLIWGGRWKVLDLGHFEQR